MIVEDNYHSKNINIQYCSASQYKDFYGCAGLKGCEARAIARIRGDYIEDVANAMLVGSYIDAYFSKNVDVFRDHNSFMFKKDGELKGVYNVNNITNRMIARINRDPFFLETLSGETQKIFTANFFGLAWKIRVDFYHAGKAIVDLKTTKSIFKKEWVQQEVNGVNVSKKLSFIKYFGYDIQGAIYQKVIEIATMEKLPFIISAVSKEAEPDIDIFNLSQNMLDTALDSIEAKAYRIIELKNDNIEPIRCGICDYCKKTKVLYSPIFLDEG